MKHLTVAMAALFLLAAPGLSLAQNNDSGTTGANTGGNGGSNDQSTQDYGGDNSGGSSIAGGDSNCNDVTPDQKYESFSEKCRKQIDDWAMAQTSKSVVVEGDVVVGTALPETVEIVEVPAYRSYGYAYVNDHRVLVNRDTRTVVRVY